MKITHAAAEYLKSIALSDPQRDEHRDLKTTDAKAILDALGVVVRPTEAITRMTDLTQVYNTVYWSHVPLKHGDIKDVLAYIEYLESK